MSIAIGYIRVSTEEQATQGISLDAQRAKIEAYALMKDLKLVDIIVEGGRSAKNLNRPGVQEILRLSRNKEVESVIIVKLDRMFRNVDDARKTATEFDQCGVALHSISESLDTKSALGRFFFTLLASIAELERGLISERTKMALAHKKTKGERVGAIPFGYMQDANSGKLVKCPEEQKALSQIRSYRKRGLSCQQIADHLNQKKVPTRNDRPWSRVWVSRLATK